MKRLEQLPSYYQPAMQATETLDVNRQLVEQLRSEMVWGQRDEALLKNAYSVSREIGDVELAQLDTTGQVIGLMDATRYYARPRHFGTEIDSLGGHNRAQKSLWASHDKHFKAVEGDHKQAIAEVITLKDPNDAELLAYMGTVAHETGHAILAGVSEMTESKGSRGYLGLSASATFIRHNPQEGLTGTVESDTAIHEERFAEGYSRMVVSKIMEALGYEPSEISTVMAVTLMQPSVRGGKGENQIDFIGYAKGGLAIHNQVKETATLDQKNAGLLGYGLPLSAQELVTQLVTTSELCQQANIPEIDEDWNSFNHEPSEAVAEYLRQIISKRTAAKDQLQEQLIAVDSPEQNRKARRLSIRRFAGMIAAGRYK